MYQADISSSGTILVSEWFWGLIVRSNTAGIVAPSRPHFESLLAGLFLLTLLVKIAGFSLVPASFIIGLFLIPVLWKQIRSVKTLRWLLLGAPIAIVTGIIAQLFSVPLFGSSSGFFTAVQVSIWVVSFPAIVGLGIWSLDRLKLRAGLILVTIGALVSSFVLDRSFEWKGTQGIYITALCLLLVAHNRLLTFIVMAGSIAVSATSDARFMAIVGVLTLLAWFATRRTKPGKKRIRGTVRMFVFLGAASALSLWAMSSGVFGRLVQMRTLDQLARPGFLISDARVEWSATTVLFQHNPLGFGLGVVPSDGLQRAGVDAVQAAGGDYTAPYFTQVVFGPRVDLHSMLADLWFHFGIGGVLVAVIIAVMLVAGLPYVAAARDRIGLAGIYMVLIGLWDLFFSPMGNSDRLIFGLLVVGVLFVQSRKRDPVAADLSTSNPSALTAT